MKRSMKEIRSESGKSQEWFAVMAGVSVPSVRIFEVAPNELKNSRVRASLEKVYADVAAGRPVTPAK